MDSKNYIFEHASSSIYLLTEQTTLSNSSPKLSSISYESLEGQLSSNKNEPKLKWCFQESESVFDHFRNAFKNFLGEGGGYFSATILAKKSLAASSKKVVLMRPSTNLSFVFAWQLCDEFCGRLYFPSWLSEITEIQKYANHNKWPSWKIWLRIFYEKRYWCWKDADKIKDLEILNWGVGEPKYGTRFSANHAMMASDGKWYASNSQFNDANLLLCELS